MRLQMAINVGCLPNDQNVGENQGKNYELILGRLVVVFLHFQNISETPRTPSQPVAL